MTIRPYQPKDRDAVRFVCLNSEGLNTAPADENEFVLATFCDYYIEKEPQNCFVAVDETDRAIGYVICAADYDRFVPVLKSEYIARLSPENPYYNAAIHSADGEEKHKADYPAHLHINILPEYQRQGLGHRLIDRLCEHLRKKGIPGVMLCVGALNKTGIGFYRKYGFTLLETLPGDLAFGIKLQ